MSITFIAWKDTLSDTEIRAENLLVRAGGGAITSKFEGRIEVSESSLHYKGYSQSPPKTPKLIQTKFGVVIPIFIMYVCAWV